MPEVASKYHIEVCDWRGAEELLYWGNLALLDEGGNRFDIRHGGILIKLRCSVDGNDCSLK